MLYINTFLDRMGEIVRGEKEIEEARELLNQEKIFEMFRNDCEEILRLYNEGKAGIEDVRRNFYLLKTYVISQLTVHFERLKKLAESKGIKINSKIEAETINEIALFIDGFERRL